MRSNLLRRIIAAGPDRRTRLHDEKGNFIGLRRLVQSGPRAISSGLLRLAFGYRPATPWISYAAIDLLESYLHPNSRVLEFGSGMSTVWLGKRAGEVHSIEDSVSWHARVAQLVAKAQLRNVHLYFAEQIEAYSRIAPADSSGYDLILVDGNYRHRCTLDALPLLRAGGVFYLDNSDRGVNSRDNDTRMAEAAALDFARERGADVRWFTDFAPTQFFVQQGLMIKLPS